MASLIITSGENAGQYFHLTKRTLSVGRDPSRDIQIVDPKVSRRHFQVRNDDGEFIVVELRNTNGVHINGQRVDGEQALRDGDVIAVGDTLVKFCVADLTDASDAVHKYKQANRKTRDDPTLED